MANNPYKYDDPSGNAYKGITTNSPYANIGVKKAMSDNKKNVKLNFSFMDTFNNVAKAVANVIKNPPKVEIPKNSTVKTTPKNVNEMTQDELIAEAKTCSEEMLDSLQTVLDWVGFLPIIGDAFDVVNGIIYILRGKYVDGLISLASAALSLAADALLKPLRGAVKKGISEIFEIIMKKLPDMPSAVGKLLKGLIKAVDGLWFVGRKIKDAVIRAATAVIDFILKHATKAIQSIRNKLKKEVAEAATEAATKGVKEATEDVIEDAVQDAIEDGISDAAIKGTRSAYDKGKEVLINLTLKKHM